MLEKVKKTIPLLENILRKHDSVGIITHKNADPDALASVLALRELLRKKFNIVEVKTIFPEGINSFSKRIVESLKLDLESINTIDGIELFIVTDTSSSTQLGEFSEYVTSRKYIVIDHHEGGDLDQKALLQVRTTDVSSSSEIVYFIGRELEVVFERETLELIMAGILFDSKRFILAKPATFNIVAELVERGADYSKVIKLFNSRPELSERIARIKASMRAKHYRVKDLIITITEVGAFEASVARSLVELGSDIVFVANQVSKNEVRLTARASPYFVEKTGIHIGRDILARLSSFFGGSGGGHDAAGGYTGYNITTEKVLEKVLELLLYILENKKYASRREIKEITRD